MKKKLLKLISTISLVLVMALSPLFSQGLFAKSTSESLQLMTRTVKVDDASIDFESVFNSYEDAKLETKGTVTTFEGKRTLKLSDLEGIEEEDLSELEVEELNLQYRYSFDYVTDMVTITVISLETNETGEVVENVVDVIEGKAFINEQGNIDAELDFDGDTILLSELQNLGVIDNCGWFKKLCKKVTTAVKKAVSTTVGKVVVAATAVTAVAVGVIGAVVAAPAVAVIAVGATVGAVGMAAATAISSKKTDGSVDWESVAYSAGVGCVAGAILSGAAYGVTKAVLNSAAKNTWGNKDTLSDHYQRHGGDFGCKNETEYAQKANEFYKNRANFQTKVDSNGVTRVYDSSTNTFGSYNPDGTTKTFFKPTGGQNYFNGQPGV